MYRIHLVRSVKPTPPQGAKRSAKVIELRVREQARLDAARARRPDRPDAA
jgi:hypothetical protein